MLCSASGSRLATHPPGRARRTISASTSAGSGTVTSKRSRMNEVERPREKSRAPGVPLNDFDVVEATARDELGSHRDVRWIAVQADDPTARRYPMCSISMMPRGPQPRSIALSPGRNPTWSNNASLSTASSSAWRFSR